MHKTASKKLVAAAFVVGSFAAWGQTPAAQPASGQKVDRATAYYHYTLAHMYAEMAGMYGGRGEYVNQAIDNYKAAIKADPTTALLSEELSEIYIQSGRLGEAQTDAEAALRANPNDLSARRLLARIYVRRVGGDGRNKIDENMLRRAIEQFQKITEADTKDGDAWLMLARLQKISNNSVDAEKAYKKALELQPENEDALTGLALVYSDLGDAKSAAELLQKVAAMRPSVNSLEALAGAYEQARDFAKAADVLRRAIELDPPNATQLKRAMAQDLEFAQKHEEALAVYQELIAQDATDSQSWLRISQIQLRLRENGKAREAIEKARAIEPASIEVRYHEVSILEAEGKLVEGIQVLKDVLTQTEKRSYSQAERASRLILLQRLGSLQKDADQLEPAAETFRQMAVVDPDAGPRSSSLVIETYRQGKMLAKAQQEADASEKKYPADRGLRLVRASLQAEMGKTDAAANDIKKLLGGKDDRETYLALAQIYDKGRKWDDMSKALDQAEKLSVDDDDKVNVWFMRGAMHERMKSIDKAEAEFRKVLAASPDNAGALNYLSYMFADRNMKLPEAKTLIDKALEQDPYNGAYLDTLGWLYYRMGRLGDAETNLMLALERVPHDPTMRDHLAEVLFQRSKYKEAVTQWEAALREWQLSSPADMDQAEITKVRNKLDSARSRVANAK